MSAIINRAVTDRRTAVSREWVDDLGNPLPGVKRGCSRDNYDVTFCLYWFFNEGGLEICLRAADFHVNVGAIKKKSKEPYA